MSVFDRNWHLSCFKCGRCNRLLAGNTSSSVVPCRRSFDNSFACESCYQISILKICTECRLVIRGNCLEISGKSEISVKFLSGVLGNKFFHNECFLCHTCRKSLSNVFFETDFGFQCEDCTRKCALCQKAIVGTSIDVLQNHYHQGKRKYRVK